MASQFAQSRFLTSIAIGDPIDSPARTPPRNSTRSCSITIRRPRPYPCWRRASSRSTSATRRGTPAGIPSTSATSAGPWDSPAVWNRRWVTRWDGGRRKAVTAMPRTAKKQGGPQEDTLRPAPLVSPSAVRRLSSAGLGSGRPDDFAFVYDVRCDEDQEVLLPFLDPLLTEEPADPGEIHQVRNARLRLGDLRLG